MTPRKTDTPLRSRLAGLLLLATFGAWESPGISEGHAQAAGDDGGGSAAAAWQLQGFRCTGPLPPHAESPSPTSGREDNLSGGDKKWIDKGYSLFWHSTPSSSDVGKNAVKYLESQGWRININKGGNSVFIAKAPDGSPSIKGIIKKDDHSNIMSIVGTQLGRAGTDKQIIASMEFYTPSVGGQKPNYTSGTYIGWGFWGSAKGVGHIPAGSVNYDNAWSVRVPLSSDNRYFLYVYIPGKDRPHGLSWSQRNRLEYDRWNKIEVEIIQNKVGQQDGVLRLYVNDEVLREKKGIEFRRQDNVRAKGFWMPLKHNHGAPEGDEEYYWRNFKIYVK